MRRLSALVPAVTVLALASCSSMPVTVSGADLKAYDPDKT
jgi:hypothetical protein